MDLVTGASGFLGKHLLKLLVSQRVAVRALYCTTAPTDDVSNLPGVEWVQGDLLDVYDVEAMLTGIDRVYHCAATVSFDPKDREPMVHANKEGAANLVNGALLGGVSKLVHMSSVAAIGRSEDGGKLITEEEEWGEGRYATAYGMSKYLAEMEVWRGIGEGLDAVILNPGIILGPGAYGTAIGKMVQLVDSEFGFYGNGVKPWVDAADVAVAAIMLMDADVSGERFILSGGNHSFKEVFGLLAKYLGVKPPTTALRPWMGGIAWRTQFLLSKLTGARPRITRETVGAATEASRYDNSKLLKMFPDFSYRSLEETIGNMAQDYLRVKNVAAGAK